MSPLERGVTACPHLRGAWGHAVSPLYEKGKVPCTSKSLPIIDRLGIGVAENADDEKD